MEKYKSKMLQNAGKEPHIEALDRHEFQLGRMNRLRNFFQATNIVFGSKAMILARIFNLDDHKVKIQTTQ